LRKAIKGASPFWRDRSANHLRLFARGHGPRYRHAADLPGFLLIIILLPVHEKRHEVGEQCRRSFIKP